MSVFASEPMSLEQPKEPEPEPQPQQSNGPNIPSDSKRVLNILGTGDINTFVSEYIKLVQGDNKNLISFLNKQFNRNDNTVFEFLFDLFKANSDEEWSLKTFVVTIMNLGLTIKDKQAPLNFYYYILLTDEDTASPIYGLVQSFSQNPPSEEMNKYFVQHWNSLFGKETFSNNLQGKTVKFPMSLSKNTRYTIILIVIFLILILGICGAYFFNKYGGDKIKLPNPPVTSGLTTDF